MSFNNYSNSYDNANNNNININRININNINNINQPPDDNIIYDTFINSSNASLVVPTENNNIQNEDDIPTAVPRLPSLILYPIENNNIQDEDDIPSLVDPTENNNIQDEAEDDMPPLVEDTSSLTSDDFDMLYSFASRYLMDSDTTRYSTDYDRISLNRIERMFVLATRQHIAHRVEREARKFNIATRVREENDEQIKIECNICYELCNNTNFIKLNCNHEFCKECIKNILKCCKSNFNEPCCAYCREKINAITYKNETIHEEFSDLIA